MERRSVGTAVPSRGDGIPCGMLSWEELDLAIACGAEPYASALSIDVCCARPRGHVLARFPFQAKMVPSPDPDGVPRIQPTWLTPRVGLRGAALPWVVSQTFDFCWKPSIGPARTTVQRLPISAASA